MFSLHHQSLPQLFAKRLFPMNDLKMNSLIIVSYVYGQLHLTASFPLPQLSTVSAEISSGYLSKAKNQQQN